MPISHPFGPIADHNSRILILGTFPSVKSRENQFYYGHPQNRFWQVIASILNLPMPQTVEEKTDMLLKNGIALWDVLLSCDISGSADSSIKNAVPNDIASLVRSFPIERIFGNGAEACKLYNRYVLPSTGIDITGLPSTSPANAAFGLERLCRIWLNALNTEGDQI